VASAKTLWQPFTYEHKNNQQLTNWNATIKNQKSKVKIM
jgi:hypothetical protein